MEADREAFRRDAASRGLTRREQYQYPPNILHDLSDFVEWLPEYTTQLVNSHGSNNVDIELLRMSALPSREAETYQQMWAYGNHYRVVNEGDSSAFVTQDCDIGLWHRQYIWGGGRTKCWREHGRCLEGDHRSTILGAEESCFSRIMDPQ